MESQFIKQIFNDSSENMYVFLEVELFLSKLDSDEL